MARDLYGAVSLRGAQMISFSPQTVRQNERLYRGAAPLERFPC